MQRFRDCPCRGHLCVSWRTDIGSAYEPAARPAWARYAQRPRFTNFSALTGLPLADATAISFASPLITVALAALVLKERVRIYRWSA
ncbi:MAG: hypothetical protein WCD73_19300, partial [Pseudolabrys sp.]